MAATRWTGKAHDGAWFDAANWSAGIPQAGQAARFQGSATYAIDLAGSAPAQAGELSVLGDVLSFDQGTLELAAPAPPMAKPSICRSGKAESYPLRRVVR